MAKPSGDHTPLGGIVLILENRGSMPMANQSQAPLPNDDAIFERRAKGRTTINRDASLFFEGQNKVHPCCVRDATNDGAGIRLGERFGILPLEFGISFDRFRTMRKCRLIWRDGDFVGASFEGR